MDVIQGLDQALIGYFSTNISLQQAAIKGLDVIINEIESIDILVAKLMALSGNITLLANLLTNGLMIHATKIGQDKRASIRDALVNLLFKNGTRLIKEKPTLMALCRLYGTLIAHQWQCGQQPDDISAHLNRFLTSDTTRWVIGLELYRSVSEQVKHGTRISKADVRSIEHYRNNVLQHVFTTCINTLKKYMEGVFKASDNNGDCELMHSALALVKVALSFKCAPAEGEGEDEPINSATSMAFVFHSNLNFTGATIEFSRLVVTLATEYGYRFFDKPQREEMTEEEDLVYKSMILTLDCLSMLARLKAKSFSAARSREPHLLCLAIVIYKISEAYIAYNVPPNDWNVYENRMYDDTKNHAINSIATGRSGPPCKIEIEGLRWFIGTPAFLRAFAGLLSSFGVGAPLAELRNLLFRSQPVVVEELGISSHNIDMGCLLADIAFMCKCRLRSDVYIREELLMIPHNDETDPMEENSITYHMLTYFSNLVLDNSNANVISYSTRLRKIVNALLEDFLYHIVRYSEGQLILGLMNSGVSSKSFLSGVLENLTMDFDLRQYQDREIIGPHAALTGGIMRPLMDYDWGTVASLPHAMRNECLMEEWRQFAVNFTRLNYMDISNLLCDCWINLTTVLRGVVQNKGYVQENQRVCTLIMLNRTNVISFLSTCLFSNCLNAVAPRMFSFVEVNNDDVQPLLYSQCCRAGSLDNLDSVTEDTSASSNPRGSIRQVQLTLANMSRLCNIVICGTGDLNNFMAGSLTPAYLNIALPSFLPTFISLIDVIVTEVFANFGSHVSEKVKLECAQFTLCQLFSVLESSGSTDYHSAALTVLHRCCLTYLKTNSLRLDPFVHYLTMTPFGAGLVELEDTNGRFRILIDRLACEGKKRKLAVSSVTSLVFGSLSRKAMPHDISHYGVAVSQLVDFLLVKRLGPLLAGDLFKDIYCITDRVNVAQRAMNAFDDFRVMISQVTSPLAFEQLCGWLVNRLDDVSQCRISIFISILGAAHQASDWNMVLTIYRLFREIVFNRENRVRCTHGDEEGFAGMNGTEYVKMYCILCHVVLDSLAASFAELEKVIYSTPMATSDSSHSVLMGRLIKNGMYNIYNIIRACNIPRNSLSAMLKQHIFFATPDDASSVISTATYRIMNIITFIYGRSPVPEPFTNGNIIHNYEQYWRALSNASESESSNFMHSFKKLTGLILSFFDLLGSYWPNFVHDMNAYQRALVFEIIAVAMTDVSCTNHILALKAASTILNHSIIRAASWCDYQALHKTPSTESERSRWMAQSETFIQFARYFNETNCVCNPLQCIREYVVSTIFNGAENVSCFISMILLCFMMVCPDVLYKEIQQRFSSEMRVFAADIWQVMDEIFNKYKGCYSEERALFLQKDLILFSTKLRE